MKINKDNVRKNIIGVEFDYKVGDKITLNNKSQYKQKNLTKEPFEKKEFWANGMVTFLMGTQSLYLTYVALKTINLKQILTISIHSNQVYASAHI